MVWTRRAKSKLEVDASVCSVEFLLQCHRTSSVAYGPDRLFKCPSCSNVERAVGEIVASLSVEHLQKSLPESLNFTQKRSRQVDNQSDERSNQN